MKKKFMITILSCAMILSLVGCAKTNNNPTSNDDENVSTTITETVTSTPVDVDSNDVVSNDVTPTTRVDEDGFIWGTVTRWNDADGEYTYEARLDADGVEWAIGSVASDWVDIPNSPSDITGTLEEAYYKHLDEHVGSRDYNFEIWKEIYNPVGYFSCPFCLIDDYQYYDNVDTITTAVAGDYKYSGGSMVLPYSNRQWTVKGNTVVYVHTIYESEDAWYSGESNPYWEMYYDNEENLQYFKDAIVKMYSQTGIRPDNVVILVNMFPGWPFFVVSTDTIIGDGEYTNCFKYDFCDYWKDQMDNGYPRVTNVGIEGFEPFGRENVEYGDELYEYFSNKNNQ